MVPSGVVADLWVLTRLKPGRSMAPERKKVLPVPLADVEATLPFLHRHVPWGGRIDALHRYASRRGLPDRRRELDMTGPIWVYTPFQHKNLWRGHTRDVAIGPKGQGIIKQFLKPDLDAFLFSPRANVAELYDAMRAKRKSKVYKLRSRAKRLALLKERYIPETLNAAIRKACLKAKVPHWTSNQLRHLAATEIRRQFSLEAAQATLGYENIATTEIYAEKNLDLVKQVALAIG
jgi:hypothetical protein